MIIVCRVCFSPIYRVKVVCVIALQVGRRTQEEAQYRYHVFTFITSDRWPRCPASHEHAAMRR